MRVGDEQMPDGIFLAGRHANQPFAAATLFAVRIKGRAFDVAGVGGSDHHAPC